MLQKMSDKIDVSRIDEGILSSLLSSFFDGKSSDSIIKIAISGILADKLLFNKYKEKIGEEPTESSLYSFFKKMAIGYVINLVMDDVLGSNEFKKSLISRIL